MKRKIKDFSKWAVVLMTIFGMTGTVLATEKEKVNEVVSDSSLTKQRSCFSYYGRRAKHA